MSTTEHQIDKLPKWAQQQIRQLTQERDSAVSALFRYEDAQTPSKVWTEDIHHLLGRTTFVKNYFQCDGLTIEQAGVRLKVRGLWDEKTPISLAWGPACCDSRLGDIAFIPESYQQARLVAPENLRP